MIRNDGELSIKNFNDTNVPVDIWFEELKGGDEYEEGYRYRLKAGNYMPRKGEISEFSLEVVSDTKEELQELVRNHIIPLYQNAINKLEKMANGELTELYYWSD